MKILKNNFLIIVSFFILLFILCLNTREFIRGETVNKNQYETFYAECSDEMQVPADKMGFCESLLNKSYQHPDFYTTFTNIVVLGYHKLILYLFIFITIPAIYYVCRYFKNNIIVNELTRKNYKKTILQLFFEAYKSVFILTTIIVVAFIFSIIVGETFDPTYSIVNNTSLWKESTMNNPHLFVSLYTLNVIVHSILYINIGLCVIRKQHNFWIASIISFLVLIGIQAFFEIGVNLIIFNIFLNSEFGNMFNIMNVLTFKDYFGLLPLIGLPIIFMLFSSYIVFVLYKNKEKFIIDCSKNE